MIAAAAICPAPPLLAGPLTGQAEVLPELRAACATAVARLLAAAPDLVVIAGPAGETGPLDPAGALRLSDFAPALRPGRHLAGARTGRPAGSDAVAGGGVLSDGEADRAGSEGGAVSALPLAPGIGALLLDEAGYTGPRAIWGIAGHEPAAGCLALGRRIAAAAPRVALLVTGDGSARRATTAPGYLDERAAPFDEQVARAVREGELTALADLDPALAADLLATGRPAWQALAGAVGEDPGGPLRAEVLYCDAPFGVGYLVAALS